MPRIHPAIPFPFSSSIFKLKLTLAVLAIVLTAGVCAAQQTTTPESTSHPLVVPAGTRIPLVLMHPIQSRALHHGDPIYAQITSPVTLGEQVLIPAGTSVEGRLDKLERRGERGQARLQSLSLIFPNGYVVPLARPAVLESAEGYVVPEGTKGRTIAAFILPEAGLGLGALIGHAVRPSGSPADPFDLQTSRMKNTAIGSMVGLAGGGVGSLLLIATSRRFSLEAGSPLEMSVPEPIVLDAQRVADAVAHGHPVPLQPVIPLPRVTTPTLDHKSPWDCPVGQERCSGSCLSTGTYMSDSMNCGRCGNSCGIGESCMGGSCRKFPEPIQ